jgi:hypothetical protein
VQGKNIKNRKSPIIFNLIRPKMKRSCNFTFINLLGHLLMERHTIKLTYFLIHRRRHSTILEVQLLRASDCEIDHCMLVVKVRERLAESEKKPQISN